MICVFTGNLHRNDNGIVGAVGASDRENRNAHFCQCTCYAGQHTDAILHVQLEQRLVEIFIRLRGLLFPVCANPTVCFVFLLQSALDVGTIALMDGNTESLGDKANDTISGERIAALGEFDGAAVLAVDNNAAARTNALVLAFAFAAL